MPDRFVEVRCPSCTWRIAIAAADTTIAADALVEDLSAHLVKRHRVAGADADALAAEQVQESVAARSG